MSEGNQKAETAGSTPPEQAAAGRAPNRGPITRSPSEASRDDLWTPGAPFHIEVEATAGRHTVHLFGELDVCYGQALERALIAIGGSEVVADLEGLTFCDASGLRAFLNARVELAGLGHEFSLRGAHGIVRRVIEITELDWLLE